MRQLHAVRIPTLVAMQQLLLAGNNTCNSAKNASPAAKSSVTGAAAAGAASSGASTDLTSVPNIIDDCAPYLLLLIGLEYAILALKGRKKSMPLNDSLTSIGIGVISQLPLLFARGIEVTFYVWIYDNWRLIDVPSDSVWCWLATLLGVDFCFYWVHRATHEVNLIWASHQVHHSSERFNLTTALRQSALQRYFVWMLYAPLALVLPPQQFAVHLQLNLVYQFWIHTETIRRLPGPIEFVFNTPSHHRVHHGRNAYCIDRNYAGVFILFDRLFGTFQAERPAEPPVFGLVTLTTRLDPVELQLDHLRYLAGRLGQLDTWPDRLRQLFYGPSWFPGCKARLGLGVYPDIQLPVKPLDPQVPAWVGAYATGHFVAALAGYGFLASHRQACSSVLMLTGCLLVLWTLSSVARLLEGSRAGSNADGAAGSSCELLRCAIMTVACSCLWLLSGGLSWARVTFALLVAFYAASCGVWLGLGALNSRPWWLRAGCCCCPNRCKAVAVD